MNISTDSPARSRTCCFTGSRPKNLPWPSESDSRCQDLLARLEKTIKEAMEKGFRHFISGMAVGVDTYTARLIIRLKEERPTLGITLEAAVPCPCQDKLWSDAQKKSTPVFCPCATSILSFRISIPLIVFKSATNTW
jgi:uncharacterized phage-like protein YoqJ